MLWDEVFAWAAVLAFALCAAAFLIKCSYEVAQRRLNVPKTLHMTLAGVWRDNQDENSATIKMRMPRRLTAL